VKLTERKTGRQGTLKGAAFPQSDAPINGAPKTFGDSPMIVMAKTTMASLQWGCRVANRTTTAVDIFLVRLRVICNGRIRNDSGPEIRDAFSHSCASIRVEAATLIGPKETRMPEPCALHPEEMVSRIDAIVGKLMPRLPPGTDLDDVKQDVCLRMLARGSAPLDNVDRYINTCIQSATALAWRKHKNRKSKSIDLIDEAAELEKLATNRAEALAQHVAVMEKLLAIESRLSPRDANLFCLLQADRRKAHQFAAARGLSFGALKSRKRRLYSTIRNHHPEFQQGSIR
jgi:DNA-directed RNA polymerase specialized sigma24 family protein